MAPAYNALISFLFSLQMITEPIGSTLTETLCTSRFPLSDVNGNVIVNVIEKRYHGRKISLNSHVLGGWLRIYTVVISRKVPR